MTKSHASLFTYTCLLVQLISMPFLKCIICVVFFLSRLLSSVVCIWFLPCDPCSYLRFLFSPPLILLCFFLTKAPALATSFKLYKNCQMKLQMFIMY